MTEETKPRKPSTPQLDRVVDAICRGDYDDNLIELHLALETRQDVLKAQVLEQVRKVFGPDAMLTVSKSTNRTPDSEDDENNPFVKKAERDGEATRSAPPPPVTSATADQIDGDRVTKDPLENVRSEAGLSVSEVERRMMSGEQVVEIENRGAIISGLSSSEIGE